MIKLGIKTNTKWYNSWASKRKKTFLKNTPFMLDMLSVYK